MKSARKSVLPYLVLFTALILFSCDVNASVVEAGSSEEDPSYPILSWFEIVQVPVFEASENQAGSLDFAVLLGELWLSGEAQVGSIIDFYETSQEVSLNINRSRFSKRRFKPDNDCEIWQIIFGMSSMIA